MVNLYLLLLLTCYLARDKIVAGLQALEKVPALLCLALVVLAWGVRAKLSPTYRQEFEVLQQVLFSRNQFAGSAVMQMLILAEVFVFVMMCHSHPGEMDGLLQIVLCLGIFLQYMLLKVALENVNEALATRLTLSAIFCLARAPRVLVPFRALAVPTPPPQSLLLVAA